MCQFSSNLRFYVESFRSVDEIVEIFMQNVTFAIEHLRRWCIETIFVVIRFSILHKNTHMPNTEILYFALHMPNANSYDFICNRSTWNTNQNHKQHWIGSHTYTHSTTIIRKDYFVVLFSDFVTKTKELPIQKWNFILLWETPRDSGRDRETVR